MTSVWQSPTYSRFKAHDRGNQQHASILQMIPHLQWQGQLAWVRGSRTSEVDPRTLYVVSQLWLKSSLPEEDNTTRRQGQETMTTKTMIIYMMTWLVCACVCVCVCVAACWSQAPQQKERHHNKRQRWSMRMVHNANQWSRHVNDVVVAQHLTYIWFGQSRDPAQAIARSCKSY